eukprot:scaffold244952_cov15-Tisochrysis_lutea.AAC.2
METCSARELWFVNGGGSLWHGPSCLAKKGSASPRAKLRFNCIYQRHALPHVQSRCMHCHLALLLPPALKQSDPACRLLCHHITCAQTHPPCLLQPAFRSSNMLHCFLVYRFFAP